VEPQPKTLLTTEDTKEHEGEPKPKLTAERRHGEKPSETFLTADPSACTSGQVLR